MYTTTSADNPPRTDDQILREVTAVAATVFTEAPRRAAAKTYLKQRGIDATPLSPEWVLGYAPPGWTRLLDRLRGQFPDQALLDAGVARRCSRGTLIDTFRERVMFGIRDVDGTIAGFIGRDLSGHPNAPKYLNTHQHALFDKSKLLFGLREGLSTPTARQLVIVEGPLDVLAIAARQATQNSRSLLPVAPSGTAFTPAHVRLVAESAGGRGAHAVVAMDGDPPGRAAALATAERLRSAGLDARIAVLPQGVDPADYLARRDATLEAFSSAAGVPPVTIQVENAIARQGDAMQWPEGQLQALRSVAAYLSTYPPDFVARQVNWLADTLGVQASTVTRELVEAFVRTDLRMDRCLGVDI